MIHRIAYAHRQCHFLQVATPPPSDGQIRSTIATLKDSAKLLLAQASSLMERAAKLEDDLSRRDESRVRSIGKSQVGPELDGNQGSQ
jgi:hypothetical protein